MLHSNATKNPRVLTIGDSFSDGSAGVQADLKTFAALSTSAMSVITALAIRKTSNENTIHTIPIDFISSQFHTLVNDIGVDALKIGMFHSSSLINCIVSFITKTKIPIVVFDPAIIITQLPVDSLDILRNELLPFVTLITPTLEETSILLGRNIVSLSDMKCAAQDLHRLGPKYVLIKGEHIIPSPSKQIQDKKGINDVVEDVLFDGINITVFKSQRLPKKTEYSIRCILSATITALLAHGIDITRAIQDAITYTHSIGQNSSNFDCTNDVLKHTLSMCSDQTPNESFKPTTNSALVVDDKQQEVVSKDHNDIVHIKSYGYIQVPRMISQQRSFIQLLKNECTQEWFDYTHHRFVEDMGNGTLPHTSFKHYLIQDYIFLTNFARCNALAAYKSSTMKEILHAANIVCHIGRESELHISYCAEWGIDPESVSSIREARPNLAYTRFTLDCGMSGDLLDLYVALSACLLGYGEIGTRLFEDPKTKQDSPYWKWISNYAAEDYQVACREGADLIERLVIDYGVWYSTVRIKKLINIFKTATELEIGFWAMGLNVEW
ncbi:unnamed protein product [Adineta steineri]|uniref:Phosphomethylpyrimidine kinase n=1 Tax=Adineta steineri TaxID=433720 RepID=A0A814YIL8_9BILA|nr:unnamed protein product [Adineta steineri]CAF1362260.1 unnamed protein product [Adineta steineri]